MSNIIIPGEVATIQGPEDLTAQVISSQDISIEDAILLRAYKKFLLKNDLREALYCQNCWGHNLADGCEAHVTDTGILIRCRCKIRTHKGSTY